MWVQVPGGRVPDDRVHVGRSLQPCVIYALRFGQVFLLCGYSVGTYLLSRIGSCIRVSLSLNVCQWLFLLVPV